MAGYGCSSRLEVALVRDIASTGVTTASGKVRWGLSGLETAVEEKYISGYTSSVGHLLINIFPTRTLAFSFAELL